MATTLLLFADVCNLRMWKYPLDVSQSRQATHILCKAKHSPTSVSIVQGHEAILLAVSLARRNSNKMNGALGTVLIGRLRKLFDFISVLNKYAILITATE